MNNLILLIKENWKDPVWSKIISAIILGIGGFIFTVIYSLIKDIPYKKVVNTIFIFLGQEVRINFILLLIVIILLVLSGKTIFISLINKVKTNTSTEKNGNIGTETLPLATEHSTSLFHHRMAGAFPEIRGLTWFNNPKIAVDRLTILLNAPLLFISGTREMESDPIWWFRGGRALHIKDVKRIGKNKIIMNFDEIKIKKIAAYRGDSYYKDFVYVEAEGESPTGLYSHTRETIENQIRTQGYCTEEYGLFKNNLGWKTLITRNAYDDGATTIRNKVKNAINAELRIRYISDYNFIIAAKGSPYNSIKFDSESKDYFNGILHGDIKPEHFFDFLKKFKKDQF